MNYNHLNKVYDYWRKELLPHLTHNFTITSFDDYLKRFSFLPSGKWLKDFEKIKLNRMVFVIDPKKFIKKYKHSCIAYNSPIKPEDGFQRIIYQISPTLHVEIALSIWIEHDNIHSYASVFACYHDEEEYLKFMDDLYSKMKREGNTEDKPIATGFAGGIFSPDDDEK